MKLELGITEVLALWGALLSTIAITITLTQVFRDRAKLQSHAYFRVAGTPGMPDSFKCVVALSITNVGRRPIILSGVYGQERRGPQFMVITDGLPKELKEGENHIALYSDLAGLSCDIKSLYVVDSFERRWPIPSKEIKKLNQDLRPENIAAQRESLAQAQKKKMGLAQGN